MSIKKMGMFMALAGLFAMEGSSRGSSMYGRHLSKGSDPPPKKFIVPDIYVDLKNVPKGHKVDSKLFEFDTHGPKVKVCVHVEYAYSSEKARRKKLIKLETELAQFIAATNIQTLSKLTGFTVIKS